ncbi:DUF4351 domain-containing protein [Clostridium sp.]|uniref:DUF4351 domain-containing protein n=1 Tax=Clostridium sp. TaxID=1506 RepID=UPI003217B3DE
MTEVGKMIYNEGKEESLEKGKAELLIKQLMKKFKILPDEYKEKIRNLSGDVIEHICTEIFDMESLEDLKKYL